MGKNTDPRTSFQRYDQKILFIFFEGVQLSERDIEALEQVFKYCQAYHMSFENTNLNDTVCKLIKCVTIFS